MSPPPARSDPEDSDFAEWYAAGYARVRRAVTLAVGDAALAEEATAEAFARALLRWRSVRQAHRPEAWVYRVALNQVRSRFRRARHRRSGRGRLDPPGGPVRQFPTRARGRVPQGRRQRPDRLVAVHRHLGLGHKPTGNLTWSLPNGVNAGVTGTLTRSKALRMARATVKVSPDDPRLTGPAASRPAPPDRTPAGSVGRLSRPASPARNAAPARRPRSGTPGSARRPCGPGAGRRGRS